MRITKFGHSCLLAEHDGVRLLLDPGTYANGFEEVTDLDGVLITHQHPDHLDLDRLPALMARNPGAGLWADREGADVMRAAGLEVTTVSPGDVLEIGGQQVRVSGGEHEIIHPDIPRVTNVGYLFGGLLHPGDGFAVPDEPVDILALAVAAPWQKVSEAVDFLRAVVPRVAVPVHDAILSPAGRALYYARVDDMKPPGCAVVAIDDRAAHDL